MASIEKRGPAQWRAMVRRKGHKMVSRTFPTRKDAEDWARDVEAQMRRRVFVDTSAAEATTLFAALDRYQREVTVKKKGAVQERKRIERFKRETFAVKSLLDVGASDLAHWRDQRLSAGRSPTTVRTDLALISHLFTVARKEWKLPVNNPVLDLTLPAAAEGRKRRLDPTDHNESEEAWLLHGAMDGEAWLLPLIRLALATAARQGELLALRWQDIDLKHRTARFAETKAGGSRTIPLSSAAVEVISSQRGGVERIGRVFPHTSNAVIKQFNKATARVGLEDLRFHDLRHEGVSRFFEAGLNHIEVAAISGHRTLQMLMRYTHPRATDLAEKLG